MIKKISEDIKSQLSEPSLLLNLVKDILVADKAIDVVVIDLREKSQLGDFMVIASGNSSRQVGAMADHIRRGLKTAGCNRIGIEGATNCDWVLIDAGDLIVHLFRPEVRSFYDLEKIWNLSISANETGMPKNDTRK